MIEQKNCTNVKNMFNSKINFFTAFTEGGKSIAILVVRMFKKKVSLSLYIQSFLTDMKCLKDIFKIKFSKLRKMTVEELGNSIK